MRIITDRQARQPVEARDPGLSRPVVNIDGVLRGKSLAREMFLSALDKGRGNFPINRIFSSSCFPADFGPQSGPARACR